MKQGDLAIEIERLGATTDGSHSVVEGEEEDEIGTSSSRVA